MLPIISAAAQNNVPAVVSQSAFARDGGLLSYGTDSVVDPWRRAATYVDRILGGAKPAELPVQQPTKFELVINLKTAKSRPWRERPSVHQIHFVPSTYRRTTAASMVRPVMHVVSWPRRLVRMATSTSIELAFFGGVGVSPERFEVLAAGRYELPRMVVKRGRRLS
jgi:hypothetical protein